MDKKCAIKNMVWSIIGLAASSLGIPGIIICSIMKKNAAEYNEKGGEPCAFNKVAGILSRIGIGIGIAMTVFWTLYFIMICVMVVLAICGSAEILPEIYEKIQEIQTQYPGAIYG